MPLIAPMSSAIWVVGSSEENIVHKRMFFSQMGG